MPLQEEDLKKLSQFSNLEKLNLKNTGIQGTHVDALMGLTSLRSLSLVGNPIVPSTLDKLGAL